MATLRALLSPAVRWLRPSGEPTPELYAYLRDLDAKVRDLSAAQEAVDAKNTGQDATLADHEARITTLETS